MCGGNGRGGGRQADTTAWKLLDCVMGMFTLSQSRWAAEEGAAVGPASAQRLCRVLISLLHPPQPAAPPSSLSRVLKLPLYPVCFTKLAPHLYHRAVHLVV